MAIQRRVFFFGQGQAMPGMMDSVLNLGLNRSDGSRISRDNERMSALGSMPNRRFIAMFASMVLGVPREQFEQALVRKPVKAGVEQDADLSVAALQELVEHYKKLCWQRPARSFPLIPMIN